MIKDGSNIPLRQFEKAANPNAMRNLAMEELSAPRRRRGRRSLRLMLPAWLTGRAVADAEEMAENMKQAERKD